MLDVATPPVGRVMDEPSTAATLNPRSSKSRIVFRAATPPAEVARYVADDVEPKVDVALGAHCRRRCGGFAETAWPELAAAAR